METALEIMSLLAGVVWTIGLPILFIWTAVLAINRIDDLRKEFWANQFEVKDILRDVKSIAIRNRELLIGDEVYNVDEVKKDENI